MSKQLIQIELLSAPRCNQCVKALQRAQQVVDALASEAVTLRVVDIVEELDYAVELGLRAAPAIAINGKLVFTAPPSEIDLKNAIQARLDKQA